MAVTVKEIIDWAREEVLDDTDPQKYLWSNAELVHHLNRAINELHKASLLVKDQTTEAIMEIKLLSNLGTYALDSRIIQVTHARLEDNADYNPLTKTTEEHLNATVSDWRNKTGTPREFIPGHYSGYLCVYPKFDDEGEILGDSDISFDTKTISQSGGDFSDLEVGDEIYVSGTVKNDGYYTVVTAGTASILVSEALESESGTSAIIRKVRDTLLMTVNRLPSTRFTEADITAETVISGIRDDHCDGLVDGIAKRAFLKPDQYTYYPNKATFHKAEFEDFKKEARRDMILLHKPDHPRKPRPGTSIGY
jgi:hypothetical protein